MSTVPTDIEIAQAAKLRPIAEVAAEIGLGPDEILPYGRYKAKITPEAIARRSPKGRLVLVSGINPTPAGEGKSTVTVGLAQALRKLGKKVVVAIREPSLGPVFGVKGGAAGGGYAQVVPMDEINLHFTGDFHAITSAHNLLSAMLDNHIHHGNALGFDTRRISWPRTIDMNDRALRSIITGLGGLNGGPSREERFVIVPGSEIMAILCLATDLPDLEQRLARIIVGITRDKKPIRAGDLKASGAMTLLLKDAMLPNLVQTLEGGPALVHGGPFGNIAHGCNSIVATKLGLALGDIVLTEAGFGADLGAEKFFDIKCRFGGLKPEAAVVVATVRALKMHGGVKKDALGTPDVAALQRGLVNLEAHVKNVQKFGVPVIVALNRFLSDSVEEQDAVIAAARTWGARAALSDVWARGGAGGEAVGNEVLAALAEGKADFKPIYDSALPIKQKIETIATQIYGADGVTFSPTAEKSITQCEDMGLGNTPVCIAKTQYSFSDDPTKLGRPKGFKINIRDVYPSAGAGFVVALAGEIMTMPGLSKTPSAEAIRVHPDGRIEGLF
ncbi:MAG: formate--tetrahydrofolate ligase [Gemmatimonadetes bacterium]|nr:formate--tetrahydrofolate ligase [Gemmatimonadota bacterium]MBK7348785.1 formate--tetrahydrofolate ligase [Gemmatimonadota bacterium]MBK7714349.1 formate--tetrahydrofolate ligase [Gemmatimonadota bacterium]MBK7783414.1 formate--tetrahydrofolate ligase [Gemmatimonadota bacterium]MBK7924353.1 formate--tetrahydrofolate ligase [Gemmatimonadota bacterium]